MSDDKSCKNCMLQKRGDCNGREVCKDYKHSPSLTEEIKRAWPEYGDATAIRLGKPRK